MLICVNKLDGSVCMRRLPKVDMGSHVRKRSGTCVRAYASARDGCVLFWPFFVLVHTRLEIACKYREIPFIHAIYIMIVKK